MDLGLAGKVAIVTGGSKGIGKAIAQELAGEGVDVAICARDRRVLEEAAKTLAAATRRRIVPIVCDTTSTKSVQDLIEATVAQLGRVDILVNNASTPGGVVTGPLASADDELLLEDINTKVGGVHAVREGGGAAHAAGGVGEDRQHRWVVRAPGREYQRAAECGYCAFDEDAGGSAWRVGNYREPRASWAYSD